MKKNMNRFFPAFLLLALLLASTGYASEGKKAESPVEATTEEAKAESTTEATTEEAKAESSAEESPEGDKVERIAEAAPSGSGNIAIPGYEKLTFQADEKEQSVKLYNPATNSCTFVLSITLEGEEDPLWKGEAIFPGEAFTSIKLGHALDKGSYQASLHYDCFSLEGNVPLNGAEIKLVVEAK